jgi:hypothetical protein
VVFIW